LPEAYLKALPRIDPHDMPNVAWIENHLKQIVRTSDTETLRLLAGIQICLEAKRAAMGWRALESNDDAKVAGTCKAARSLREAIDFIKNLIPREYEENYAGTCREYRNSRRSESK